MVAMPKTAMAQWKSRQQEKGPRVRKKAHSGKVNYAERTKARQWASSAELAALSCTAT